MRRLKKKPQSLKNKLHQKARTLELISSVMRKIEFFFAVLCFWIASSSSRLVVTQFLLRGELLSYRDRWALRLLRGGGGCCILIKRSEEESRLLPQSWLHRPRRLSPCNKLKRSNYEIRAKSITAQPPLFFFPPVFGLWWRCPPPPACLHQIFLRCVKEFPFAAKWRRQERVPH